MLWPSFGKSAVDLDFSSIFLVSCPISAGFDQKCGTVMWNSVKQFKFSLIDVLFETPFSLKIRSPFGLNWEILRPPIYFGTVRGLRALWNSGKQFKLIRRRVGIEFVNPPSGQRMNLDYFKEFHFQRFLTCQFANLYWVELTFIICFKK